MDAETLYHQIFQLPDKDERAMKACELAFESYSRPQITHIHGREVAEILKNLNLDKDTLIATLISDRNLEPHYSLDRIEDAFGQNVAQLVKGIRQLNSIKEFPSFAVNDEVQTERLRQMLLAMTSDIRIMIVKLAYRVARLRNLKAEDEAIRVQIATETQLIFAPLANRLGIAQLKWELEDLSFRFLNPDIYKSIAKQLDSKRLEREEYIQTMISAMDAMLSDRVFEYKISGRPKHIYSIWRKMTKKHLTLDELYDLRAIRIYVETVEQCYEVLGLIHSRWNYIKSEFDDYIASPKENGYQSIHTVVLGPTNQPVEIQIRTNEMHHHAEYGVAAHWRYKESGSKVDARLEKSISLVRQMLENNENPDLLNEISTELLSEHIYVLTPRDQIISLSQGCTPIDFAYQIHTDLGHRCRGAKVNGRIVPLNTTLKTGDRVEVLTVKDGGPNRNWLNPNLNYLGSSRSRNKVRHWFNQQNKDANIQAGEALFHKEIKRLHAESLTSSQVVKHFKLESEQEFFESVGKGRINERQLINAIQKLFKPKHAVESASDPQKTKVKDSVELNTSAFADQARAFVVGAPQLKTVLAPCCHPVEGDEITGYVTRGRGITVHRKDCKNILKLTYEEQKRLIPVSWTRHQVETVTTYEAVLELLCFDRKGLLRDIMSLLAELDVNVISSDTHTDKRDNSVHMKFKIEVESGSNVGMLLDKLEQISNVASASIQWD